MKPIVMDPVAARDEDEALFARDEAGQLIRVDPATEADYAKEVTVTIDGRPVKVRKAYPTKDAQGNVERKLLPACQHRVEDKMEVHTMDSPAPKHGKRVRDAVKVLTEMLTADHLPPDTPPEPGARTPLGLAPVGHEDERSVVRGDEDRSRNELRSLGQRMGVRQPRFAPNPADRGKDESSVVIAVDHNRCIMCDRCVRACDEVKE